MNQRPIQPSPRQQSGAALLAALLLMAIGLTMAINLLWSANLHMHQVRNLNYMDQARMYALGAEAWAADTLITDLAESQSDSLDEVWAIALPPLPIEGGQLNGTVEDLQGRFNVNNIVDISGQKDQIWFDALVRLMISLDIDPIIADSIVDWIDPDVDVSFPNGAEDDVYTGLEPSYRAANAFLHDVSELRAVNGIDAPTYDRVKPYLTALPRGTLVNVNTANEFVLASLSETATIFDAQLIVENRIGQPYETLSGVSSFLPQDALALATVSSEYFGVRSVVALGTTQFSMYSLLERDAGSSAVTARVRRSGYD